MKIHHKISLLLMAPMVHNALAFSPALADRSHQDGNKEIGKILKTLK